MTDVEQVVTYKDNLWTVVVNDEWLSRYGELVIPKTEGYIHYCLSDDDPLGPMKVGDKITWWCNDRKVADAEILREEEWRWIVGNRAIYIKRLS